MLGRAVPSLKTLLLALAIIDDLMAIIVIAIFYTADLSAVALALGGVGVAALVVLNLFDLRKPALYLVVGLFTWVCVLKSGVHATLAGSAAVRFAMPLAKKVRLQHSMLEQTEHALKPWVSYAIVPIFAFANAGVSLGGVAFADIWAPVPLGIIAGLFMGKQFGVFGASIVAIKLGFSPPCRRARLFASKTGGIAILTGIGFTMSYFIQRCKRQRSLSATSNVLSFGILAASLAARSIRGLVAGRNGPSG